jgi:SAM-dependent methyltransferase
MSVDTLIDSYDQTYLKTSIQFSDFSSRFPRHRNEALVKLAGQGKRVLEIGCGYGNVLYNLRHNFSELYGLEISSVRAGHLQEAAKAEGLNCTIQTGNIETGLDFPDQFFDVIIWADVIEHVVDVWAAMAEINRLLTSQGRLVTATPNIAALRHRLTLLRGKFPATSGSNEGLEVRPGELFDGGHLHYFTFSSLANLYKKYQIEPSEVLGFGKLGYFHNLYPALLSGSVCMAGHKQGG